jgi:carboxypeptidase Q
MLGRNLTVVILFCAFLIPNLVFAQTAPAKNCSAPKEVIEKIKDEGMNRSQALQTLSFLTDVIGARLTNSPQMKRANEWTRDTMTKWGLQNARLEPWGQFGRGWSLKSFSVQVVAPQAFPIIAYPKAWSPSTKGAVTADVIYLNAKTVADLEKYKGRLAGKIVLVSDERELKASFEAMARRWTDEELAKMASAPDPATVKPQPNNSEAMRRAIEQFVLGATRTNFAIQEGAAVVINNSGSGSGGTLFVGGASVARELSANPKWQEFYGAHLLQPYQKEAESKMVPQVTMATEDYNRLMRMINLGENVKMTIDLQARYHDEDLAGYNTIAEIPGTDLKDEIVMLGAHLDSWHASTGATDNAAGVAVVMEAARIIQTLGLKPRRTIRVALWSGEEQGILGSAAYVKQHFGEKASGGNSGTESGQTPQLIKKSEYEKLSAYYNLDNGTGKIRGIYLQGNTAAAPIFRQWLEPFTDLGATTVTLSNTGGTDHIPFDAVGLPGFQFIQDQIEYSTRTHHSNQDNFDRIQADDVKQAATIMAAFVYQTAMMDEKIPRKAMK